MPGPSTKEFLCMSKIIPFISSSVCTFKQFQKIRFFIQVFEKYYILYIKKLFESE